MPLPSGTVTFLFTDIEGSTRLWQEHPEAMKSALAHHDEILSTAVTQHDGHVVKTTGDGVHAAFADAQDAIDAAVAGQLALREAALGATAPLVVRMGIHSGPAELRDGDYYGTTLNRAARLMSTAHGGQIVVSLATKELAHDGGVELVDLGEHALRDLARPERVFQVAHPDLERAFPRLRSLDAFAGNLPVQFTSFVGRDDEMARVVAMLDDASLVTLIGTGGVGKTRLAIQAAAEAVPHFADGAWFCELAAVDHDDAMAQVVAATLGCLQRAGLSLVDSIVEYVKVRELLLILDNCEHLLDEAGALAGAVLRACPKVTRDRDQPRGIGDRRRAGGAGAFSRRARSILDRRGVGAQRGRPPVRRSGHAKVARPRSGAMRNGGRSGRSAGASTASRSRSSWPPLAWRR